MTKSTSGYTRRDIGPLAVGAVGAMSGARAFAATPAKPNILILIADDPGLADVRANLLGRLETWRQATSDRRLPAMAPPAGGQHGPSDRCEVLARTPPAAAVRDRVLNARTVPRGGRHM